MPGRNYYADTTTYNVGTPSTTTFDTTVISLDKHGFYDSASVHPYLTVPDIFDSSLNGSNWTNSRNEWTNYAGNTGMGRAIAFDNTVADTATVTLIMNIASGKKVDIKSFSFYHRSSPTGYSHWKMFINGSYVGDSTLFVSSGSTLKSTGTRQVSNSLTGLTGNITVVLQLYGHNVPGNAQGTFRMDDFILNGFVNDEGSNSGGSGRYVNKGGYRYAFNGQEKSDEINGIGNLYTAKFWEYDSRIGRRWNLDPVIKPWQSAYSAFSNSPVWKLDPHGDDDFFNSDGTFAYRTKTGTNIKLLTKEGVKLFSQVLPNNPANIKALAKVVAYYAPRATIPIGTKVGISPNMDGNKERGQGKTLAFTGQDGIIVIAKGGVDPSFNNYNNLTSTLFHEEKHREAGDAAKGDKYKFTDHTAIYEKQFDDNSFKSTDPEYKVKRAASYVSYLLGALKADQIDDNDFDVKIKNMNSKFKRYNITISTQRSANPIPAMTVLGKNNQGKLISSGFIAPQTDPH